MTEIHQTQRGFNIMDPMLCSYGEEIVLQESSAAFDPHLWLRLTVPNDLNETIHGKPYPSGVTEVSAHISAHQAWELRERLDQMLANHGYGDVRPGGPYWDEHEVGDDGRQIG